MFFVPNQYIYSMRQMNAIHALNSLMGEPSQRTRFTKEEDERLKQLVSYQDTPNWNDIARYMHNRSARQCRERYNNYLRPTLVNGPWTEEENYLLTSLYEKYGPKWSLIAQSFNGRSAVNIKNHHSSLVSQLIVKNRSDRVIKSNEHQKINQKENVPIQNDDNIDFSLNQTLNNDNKANSSEHETNLIPKIENDHASRSKHEIDDHSFDNMFANFQNEEDFLWSSSLVPATDDNVMAF